MKLLIFGMEPCIHCRQAKAFLDAENIPYMFFDITESTANMKKFLKLRDTEPLFDDVKNSRSRQSPGRPFLHNTL